MEKPLQKGVKTALFHFNLESEHWYALYRVRVRGRQYSYITYIENHIKKTVPLSCASSIALR